MNEMKRLINLWLMAALVCGLGLSVTSCKDDDDDNGSESGTQEEQMAEQTNDFWAVVGQLVGTTNATDDYRNKTFEPIIGEAVAGNETVRRVLVNTMESAAERFESLVGLDEGTVTAETGSYTWTSDAVGTLTYTKSQDGQSLATVDVNIKQVPGLRQIVYMTPEQMGTNAAEDSWRNCYYHFGDVIKRKTDEGITEYWICVRPSFDPEGKKNSHWVTVSPLPAKNIATYTASNGKTYTVPTKLGQDDKQMENLAEMLYAMYDPEKWEDNITDNPGGFLSKEIEIFQDFHRANIQYFSKEFWERVQKGWDERNYDGKDLWSLLFGLNKWDLVTDEGLHLLYYGYKWKWSISNSLSLYEQVFTPGGKGTKSNMHNMKKRTVSHNVIFKNHPERDIHVNVAAQYTEDNHYLENDDLCSSDNSQQFFGEDDNAPHYIFRFATGEELAKQSGAAYDRRTKISGFEDVYVYTLKYALDVNKGCEKRKDIQNATTAGSLAQPKVGCFIGADGNFYEKKAQAIAKGGGAVAIVVALRDKQHPLENGTQYNGMAMALKLTEAAAMNAANDYANTCGLDETAKTWDDMQKMLNGLAVSQKMAEGCGKGHNHPAVRLCVNYDGGLTADGQARHHYSSWFMPTFGQWLVAIQACGFVLPTPEKGNGETGFFNANEARLNNFSTEHELTEEEKLGQMYWTCSLDLHNYDPGNPSFQYASPASAMHTNVFHGNDAYVVNYMKSRPYILFEY